MKILMICLLLTAALFCCRRDVEAGSSKATVTNRISGCDYFVVEVEDDDYTLLDLYSGTMPSRGDLLYGNFSDYGVASFYDKQTSSEIRAYVEDYSESKETVLEKLTEHCK